MPVGVMQVKCLLDKESLKVRTRKARIRRCIEGIIRLSKWFVYLRYDCVFSLGNVLHIYQYFSPRRYYAR